MIVKASLLIKEKNHKMTKQVGSKVLLIGYGNPGRLDDGLGPFLAETIEKLNFENVTVDSNYQLTVEDASAVAEHDVVIFADASVNCNEPFTFTSVEAKDDLSFSTHSIEPAGVMALAEQLFKAKTDAFVLGIRGYEFNEFGQKLSEGAKENLDAAVKYLKVVLPKRDFMEVK